MRGTDLRKRGVLNTGVSSEVDDEAKGPIRENGDDEDRSYPMSWSRKTKDRTVKFGTFKTMPNQLLCVVMRGTCFSRIDVGSEGFKALNQRRSHDSKINGVVD